MTTGIFSFFSDPEVNLVISAALGFPLKESSSREISLVVTMTFILPMSYTFVPVVNGSEVRIKPKEYVIGDMSTNPFTPAPADYMTLVK